MRRVDHRDRAAALVGVIGRVAEPERVEHPAAHAVHIPQRDPVVRAGRIGRT